MSNEWQDLEIGIGKGGETLEPGEHVFELRDVEYKEKVVVNPDAPDEARGKELGELDTDLQESIEPKWCADSLTLVLREDETSMVLNTSFWVRNLRVNVSDDPTYKSKFGSFLERCGFDLDVNVGNSIKLGDLLRVGNKYKALTFKDANGYSRIDQDTLTLLVSGKETTKKVSNEPTFDKDEEEVLAMIKKMEGHDQNAVVSVILKEAKDATVAWRTFESLKEKGIIRKEGDNIFFS